MNAELFEALDSIEKEKGIPKERMIENIERALLAAVRRENMGNLPDNVRVIVDEQAGQMRLISDKVVVKDVTDPKSESSVEDAKKINRKAKVGDTTRLWKISRICCIILDIQAKR
jgi:N utilization substance protein A